MMKSIPDYQLHAVVSFLKELIKSIEKVEGIMGFVYFPAKTRMHFCSEMRKAIEILKGEYKDD